jgi:hypothetical protein
MCHLFRLVVEAFLKVRDEAFNVGSTATAGLTPPFQKRVRREDFTIISLLGVVPVPATHVNHLTIVCNIKRKMFKTNIIFQVLWIELFCDPDPVF